MKWLLMTFVGSVIFYCVILTAIWLLSVQTVYPTINEMFDAPGRWVIIGMCLVTLLLMTPFLWALVSDKYNYPDVFLKLWIDDNYNHGRLVALILFRVSVAVFFIAGVVISFCSLNYGRGIVIAVAVLALLLIFRENLTQYSHLETHFLTYLNGREEAAR